MDINNKTVCIIGFGKSGSACAKKLLPLALCVKVSDSRKREQIDPEYFDGINERNISFEFEKHTDDFICDSDLIVLSPGVHLDIPPLNSAREKNITIISEIELAFSFFTKPVIAVTGTNGKTTTTMLIGEIFKRAGFRIAVAGNIGTPLISIDDGNLDYIIAEISSYQLEGIDKFKPHIAVILNIAPDHLERYKNIGAYIEAKKRIFLNQTQDDFIVYNADDLNVIAMIENAAAVDYPFSTKLSLEKGTFVNDGFITALNENVIEAVCKIDEIKIKGAHNVENCLAAAQAALLCGIPRDDIAKTFKEFKGVEHRIEFVREVDGKIFINDSKATNPDSTIVALKSVSNGRNIILILGGRDKMCDLKSMCDIITQTVKDVVVLGEAKERIIKELEITGFKNIHEVSSMKDAVLQSFSLANKGDKVLLSPACASFDMFKDYEDRGKTFKEIVMGEL